jgi:phospholipid transport system substrate-binding protein
MFSSFEDGSLGTQVGSAAGTGCVAVVLLMAVSKSDETRTPGPMESLKNATQALERTIRRRYPSWSPEAEGQRGAIRRSLGDMLDYREFATRSLGTAWSQLGVAEQEEFVTLLGGIVEQTFIPGKADDDSSYSVVFEHEELVGREARVFAHLSRVADGTSSRVALEYRLVRPRGRWVVFDVVTDGDSLLEDYQRQFAKILSRGSTQGLLRRMRSKARDGHRAP